jgi:hypothetical protein
MNEELSIKMKKGSQEPGASARLPAKALVRHSLGGGGSATVGADACPRHSAFAVGTCRRLLAVVGDIFQIKGRVVYQTGEGQI